jgi:hypothetical protein
MLGETPQMAWDQIPQSTFDDLVSVLLSRLRDVKRRDGSGGDGGRDCYFDHPGGTDVWQLKSFTGRLGKSQRRQIARSLERTRESETPTSWTLVLPIDLNESEEDWFLQLTADCGFTCDWKGLIWLDEQMAAHPDLPRYYLLGVSERVLELLSQLHEEQAGLVNGLPDAIERMRGLAGLLDELSPHYRFDVSVMDGTTSVAVRPRYPGAELDAPLRFHANLSFPTTDEGRQAAEAFKDALHFGRAIDLPQEFVRRVLFDAPAGLGVDSENARLSIGAAEERDLDLPIRLRLVKDNDTPIAELIVQFTERNRGTGGVELRGHDLSGMLSVEICIDFERSLFTFHYEQQPVIGISPSALEPTVHFLQSLRAPARLMLSSPQVDGGHAIGPAIDIEVEESAIEEDAATLIGALATLERHSHIQLQMPSELSVEQVRAVLVAARLVRGEHLSGTWTELNPDVFRERARELIDGTRSEGVTMLMQNFSTIEFCGVDIPLGTVQTHYLTAVVADPEAVQQVLDESSQQETVKVKLVPAEDNRTETRLLAETNA